MIDKKDMELELEKVIEFLKKKKEILTVILFGSYARGEYSIKHSDIDLYLIVDKDLEDDFNAKFKYESDFSNKIAQLKLKVPFHFVFQYNTINKHSTLLRYNLLKEGKILFERKKVFFTKSYFDIEEYLFLKIDYGNKVQYQKSNLKISLLKKPYVLFMDFGYICIKKEFLREFHELSRKKKFEYKELYEFLYRNKQEYDSI
jgi:predicted nucleotidyltransferase